MIWVFFANMSNIFIMTTILKVTSFVKILCQTLGNLLKEKFQDELEFDIVSFSNDPNRPIFSIDIQELGPLPNYTSVVWTYTTTWKQIWFGPR